MNLISMDSTYTNRNEISWNNADQCLEIDFSKMLNRSCRLFINGWQQGLEWCSETEGELFRPAFFCSPGLNLLSQQDHPAINQWKATCPENLVSALAAYRVGQFELLLMCAQWQEAYDLFNEHPLVLWLVYIVSTKQRWPRHIIKSCLNRSPEQVMQQIGLQGSKDSLKILSKVVIHDFDFYDADLLMQSLRSDKSVCELGRHPSITKYMLLALHHYPWIVHEPIGLAFSDQTVTLQSYLPLANIVRECYKLVLTEHEKEELSLCRGIMDLKKFQQRQRNLKLRHILKPSDYSELLLQSFDEITVPLPPNAGTDKIRPVDTKEKLAALPSLTNCCLADKIKMVLEGKYYFYVAEREKTVVLLGITIDARKLSHLDSIKYRPMPLQVLPEFIIHWLNSVLPTKSNVIPL